MGSWCLSERALRALQLAARVTLIAALQQEVLELVESHRRRLALRLHLVDYFFLEVPHLHVIGLLHEHDFVLQMLQLLASSCELLLHLMHLSRPSRRRSRFLDALDREAGVERPAFVLSPSWLARGPYSES